MIPGRNSCGKELKVGLRSSHTVERYSQPQLSEFSLVAASMGFYRDLTTIPILRPSRTWGSGLVRGEGPHRLEFHDDEIPGASAHTVQPYIGIIAI